MYKLKAAEWRPQHFKWEVIDRVGTVTLNRPERKNPLTLESYAELRDTFHKLQYAEDVRVVVFTGAGGNFCSGGDVHEIIGPLTRMDMSGLIAKIGLAAGCGQRRAPERMRADPPGVVGCA